MTKGRKEGRRKNFRNHQSSWEGKHSNFATVMGGGCRMNLFDVVTLEVKFLMTRLYWIIEEEDVDYKGDPKPTNMHPHHTTM
jgi:hypothetical protein